MARKQFTLKKITCIENGKAVADYEAENVLEMSISQPSTEEANVSFLKSFDLKDGQVIDLSNEGIYKRLMFKVNIEGDSELAVKLSLVEKYDPVQKTFIQLIGQGITTFGGKIPIVGNYVDDVMNLFDGTDIDKEIKGKMSKKGFSEHFATGKLILNETVSGVQHVSVDVPKDMTLIQITREKRTGVQKGVSRDRVSNTLKLTKGTTMMNLEIEIKDI